MEIILADSPTVAATKAAELIARAAKAAVNERGQFVMAVSGGSTPALMFDALTRQELPWSKIAIFQVDERAAPAGSHDRNLTQLRQHLIDPLPDLHVYSMPVEQADLKQASLAYAQTVAEVCGGVFDLVHLGCGDDGHTASLVPDDPVLEVTDHDIWFTGPYRGFQRLTMTYPLINRARSVMFLATGSDKAPWLAKLKAHDPSIPAGRVQAARTALICDRAAATNL